MTFPIAPRLVSDSRILAVLALALEDGGHREDCQTVAPPDFSEDACNCWQRDARALLTIIERG